MWRVDRIRQRTEGTAVQLRRAHMNLAALRDYLKGISTGDMGEALSVLLGDDAKGFSANVVSRLKAQWSDEHVAWSRRDMSVNTHSTFLSYRHRIFPTPYCRHSTDSFSAGRTSPAFSLSFRRYEFPRMFNVME